MGKQTTPMVSTGSQWDGSGWRAMIRKIQNVLGIGPNIDAQGIRELYDSWVATRKPKDTSPDVFLKWIKTEFRNEPMGKSYRFGPDEEESFKTSFNVGQDITNAMGGGNK
jgi:hypothetical protein